MEDPVTYYVSRYAELGLTGSPATLVEIEALERRLGLVFPAAYRAFLLILGRDGGTAFVGSDCTIRYLPELRDWATELLNSSGSAFQLPEKAVVFLMHQGYVFLYFVADGSTEDPPVYSYLEGDDGPKQKSETFSAWLNL